MSNPYEIDDSKQTEYNSNQLIILQIAQLNQLIQEGFVLGDLERVRILLRQYYTLIRPKIIQFKKSESQEKIERLFKTIDTIPLSAQRLITRNLQTLYDEIYFGADIVGMGMTQKQSMSSIANDI